MAFFDDFTAALKQKWLQYYQLNQSWLNLQMEVESVKTPDGGRRPSSYLILGVLNALEPKLAQLMLPFSKLNSNPDSLIDVLELNFDPDIATGNRPPSKAASTVPTASTAPTAPTAPTPYTESAMPSALDATDDFGEESFDDLVEEKPKSAGLSGAAIAGLGIGAAALGVGAIAAASAFQEDDESDELMDLDELDEEPTPTAEELSAEGLDDLGLDDFGSSSLEELSARETAGFADVSLEAFDESLTEESSTEEDEFGGLGDVWGDETSSESNEESLADFGDISLDEFGSESKKKSDEEDDAFADLDFDPFGDPQQNKRDDEWK